MKSIYLFIASFLLSLAAQAQTPPDEVTFSGSLTHLKVNILPQKQVDTNGGLSEIIRFEVTFVNTANQTLKVFLTRSNRTYPEIPQETISIVNGQPKSRINNYVRLLKNKKYNFKLTKVCIDAKYGNDYTLYHELCLPQANDCAKVVFKTENILEKDATYMNYYVEYEGYLYKMKITSTDVISSEMRKHGFKD